MPKILNELNEWAVALRNEGHPLSETMEGIAEGWREDVYSLLIEKEHLKDALSLYATDEGPHGLVVIHALQFAGTETKDKRFLGSANGLEAEDVDLRLMAAAPEMLEMLDEIALQIRRGQDISERYSEIADTIAKAKPDTAWKRRAGMSDEISELARREVEYIRTMTNDPEVAHVAEKELRRSVLIQALQPLDVIRLEQLLDAPGEIRNDLVRTLDHLRVVEADAADFDAVLTEFGLHTVIVPG